MALPGPVVSGSVNTTPPPTTASNLDAIALAANTPTTILGPNANRRYALIQNDSGQDVMLRFGGGVTTSLYSVKVKSGERYQTPDGMTAYISAVSVAAGAAVAAGAGLFVTDFSL
ncbi:hypothetical protein SEA_DOTI_42 [Microbacterium phage DoTi]|nr:hypothetical protein SEA_DOTI_42 [Microbacterium phage DoTi]